MIRLDVKVSSGALMFDKAHLRAVLRGAGSEIGAVARSLVSSAVGTGRVYSKPGGGTYRASAPGEVPVSRTGVLAGSFRTSTFRSGEGVAIRSSGRKAKRSDFYALFLEAGAHGGGRRWRNKPGATHNAPHSRVYLRGGGNIGTTRRLEPRPFLSRALASRAVSISRRITVAVNQGLTFVRVKP